MPRVRQRDCKAVALGTGRCFKRLDTSCKVIDVGLQSSTPRILLLRGLKNCGRDSAIIKSCTNLFALLALGAARLAIGTAKSFRRSDDFSDENDDRMQSSIAMCFLSNEVFNTGLSMVAVRFS